MTTYWSHWTTGRPIGDALCGVPRPKDVKLRPLPNDLAKGDIVNECGVCGKIRTDLVPLDTQENQPPPPPPFIPWITFLTTQELP